MKVKDLNYKQKLQLKKEFFWNFVREIKLKINETDVYDTYIDNFISDEKINLLYMNKEFDENNFTN